MKKSLLVPISVLCATLLNADVNYDFNKDHFVPFDMYNLSDNSTQNSLPAWYINNNMLRNRNYEAKTMLLVDSKIKDFNYEVSFNINYLHQDLKNTQAGFVFSYENTQNYLLLNIKNLKNSIKRIELIEIKNNKQRVIKKIDYVFTNLRSDFKIKLENENLTLNIEDKKIYNIKDKSFKKQLLKTGFYLNKSSKNIAFDNLSIKGKMQEKKEVIVEKKQEFKTIQTPIIKKEVKNKKLVKETKNSKYYLNYGLSFAKTSLENKDTISNSIDDKTLAHNFELGLFLSKNFSTSINYDYLNFDNSKLNNIFLAGNYHFENNLNPFVGLRLGTSMLKWDNNLTNTNDNDLKANSLLLGLQAGFEYKFENNFSLIGKYSYDYVNHKTKIDNSSDLKHKSINQLGLALRYYFK